MPSSLFVRLALIAGVTTAALAPNRRAVAVEEPFRFELQPVHHGASGEEVWNATVKPEGARDSLPPAFQLRLAPPGRGSTPGAVVQAVLRRGDQRGRTFMLVMLGATFGPSPRSSSGALRRIAVEPADSIPLALTVNQPAGRGPWTALATLPNGGRFELAIDTASKRGEFRSVGREHDNKVFFGLAALAVLRRN